jgi:hypothetical protein
MYLTNLFKKQEGKRVRMLVFKKETTSTTTLRTHKLWQRFPKSSASMKGNGAQALQSPVLTTKAQIKSFHPWEVSSRNLQEIYFRREWHRSFHKIMTRHISLFTLKLEARYSKSIIILKDIHVDRLRKCVGAPRR